MSVVSFDPKMRMTAVKKDGRSSFNLRRSLRLWWRGLPLGLRDGCIIALVLAALLNFSILLHLLVR